MVRPRTGDFKYSDEEVAVMIEDIRILKKQNIRGVVVGLLSEDGRVDIERTKRYDAYRLLVFKNLNGHAGLSMKLYHWKVRFDPSHPAATVPLIWNELVCFHRAFDMTRDSNEGPNLLPFRFICTC